MSSLVRPRVISPVSGETLLLEDALDPYLQRGVPGTIGVTGAPGSGKSAALRSLAARIPKGSILELLDEPEPARVLELCDRMLVVYTGIEPLEIPHLATFALADWGEDEAIEYLLAEHKDRCASVMRRLRTTSAFRLPDHAELWKILLEEMASDDSVADFEAALRRHLGRRIPARLLKKARSICFHQTAHPKKPGADVVSLWGHPGLLGFLLGRGISKEDVRLLRHPRVRMALAAERLAGEEAEDVYIAGLADRLPHELIKKAGARVSRRRPALEALEAALRSRVFHQAMGVSLLHAAAPGWRPPDQGPFTWFLGAHLAGADWSKLVLPSAQFSAADLTGANLAESTLDGSDFSGARLVSAVLRRSNLLRIEAKRTDFCGADLSDVLADHACFDQAQFRNASLEGAGLRTAFFRGADFRGANLRRADLRGSIFQSSSGLEDVAWQRVKLAGADLTGADLRGTMMPAVDLRGAILAGARFELADLSACNLEGIELPGGIFRAADLRGANLTGTIMPGASFRRARLSRSKLGEIEWERADLRGADLRHVSFHMGSSRSGLVFGDPSEGTRNGFYTDDYYDQSYRPPEEIRVANLRGADLRGAELGGTDFYLVDLREARVTSLQEAYLRRCGAILETRV
jgi:uncharacterized protein YjbI with pentapeptide repeats